MGRLQARRDARKLLDTTRLTSLGFTPEIPLRDGIARTYAWWLDRLPTRK